MIHPNPLEVNNEILNVALATGVAAIDSFQILKTIDSSLMCVSLCYERQDLYRPSVVHRNIGSISHPRNDNYKASLRHDFIHLSFQIDDAFFMP